MSKWISPTADMLKNPMAWLPFVIRNLLRPHEALAMYQAIAIYYHAYQSYPAWTHHITTAYVFNYRQPTIEQWPVHKVILLMHGNNPPLFIDSLNRTIQDYRLPILAEVVEPASGKAWYNIVFYWAEDVKKLHTLTVPTAEFFP